MKEFIPFSKKVGSLNLFLNKVLQVLQPHRVLPAVFADHVLVQEICCAGFNPTNLKIFVESFLQVLVQITEKEKEKSFTP